jgi:hypothetical protein
MSLSNRIQIRTMHTRSRLSSVHLQNLRFIETTKFEFLPQEIAYFVTWKPTHFLRPGTRLRTNFLFACWPPEGSQWTWNIVVIHTIRNTAFTQLIFLCFVFLFIWLKYFIVIAWVGPYTSECTDHVRHCWTAHCSNTPALGLSGLFVCFLTRHKVFK